MGLGPSNDIKSRLIGAWRLITFANIDCDGNLLPWDGELSGTLIYIGDTVSVSINRWRNLPDGSIEERNSFYTGKYRIVDDKTVEHTIEQSSQRERIGAVHSRGYTFEDDGLILEGVGLTGTVRLKWVPLAEYATTSSS